MLRIAAAAVVALLLGCSAPAPKEPSANPPSPKASASKTSVPKEPTAAEALGVPAEFVSRYEVVETRRFDVAGAPRLAVKVRVPRGLDRTELEMNVRHALLKAYEGGPVRFGAVSVAAYSSEETASTYDTALGEFAPRGQWSEANPDVPLSDWRAKVDIAEHYFQERKEIAVGTRATLAVSEFSDTVDLSDKANRWFDEDIIARLKPGVRVVVLDSKDFGPAGVRYEVETASRPKRKGWVHAFELKPE